MKDKKERLSWKVQGCNDLLASFFGKDVSAIFIPALPNRQSGSRTISTAAS
jgi:hypothetical protein